MIYIIYLSRIVSARHFPITPRYMPIPVQLRSAKKLSSAPRLTMVRKTLPSAFFAS